MEYGAAIIVSELGSLELTAPSPGAAAVYDQPIGSRLLYEDPGGEEHYVVRYPARLKGRPHRHTAAHTIIVLEGQLDANGRVIGPGSYAHFPAGEVMRHQAAGDLYRSKTRRMCLAWEFAIPVMRPGRAR